MASSRDYSQGPSKWWLIGAGVIVVVGLTSRLLFRDDSGAPSPPSSAAEAESSGDDMGSPSSLFAFESSVGTARAGGVKSRKRVIQRAVLAAPEAIAAPTTDEEFDRLVDGPWRASVSMGSGEEITDIVRLYKSEETLYVNGADWADSILNGFSIENRRVWIETNGPVHRVEAEGGFNESYSRLHLRGRVVDVATGRISDLEITFVPATGEAEDDDKALRNERRGEIRKLHLAAERFAQDHDGAFPKTLEELVPDYLPDLGKYADGDRPEFLFDPSGTGWLHLPADLYSSYKELGAREAIIAKERDTRELWGEEFLNPRPRLTVRYGNPAATFYAGGARGVFQDRDAFEVDGEEVAYSPFDVGPVAALQRACANHMKQLGLTAKMFQAESREDRYPAGFYSLYPESLLSQR